MKSFGQQVIVTFNRFGKGNLYGCQCANGIEEPVGETFTDYADIDFIAVPG